MQKSTKDSTSRAVLHRAAKAYVERLFSRSGDSDLTQALKGESFKSICRLMVQNPEVFAPYPRPEGAKMWQHKGPVGAHEFLKCKVVLPSFPQIQKLLQDVISDPKAGKPELVEAISLDPKLVAAVLRLANKGLGEADQKIDTVAKAVDLFGFKKIGGLALGASAISMFKRPGNSVLNVEQFWKHSVACAVIAEVLARRLGFDEPDRYFAGGVLHDVGLLFIFEKDDGLGLELLKLAKDRDESLYRAEKELLGFNHAQLSGTILDEWKFPKHLVAAAAGHHAPGMVKYNNDAMVVHLADFISRALGYSPGVSTILGFVDHDSWKKTGLSGDEFLELLPGIRTRIDSIFDILKDGRD
ncbi:HDOD domain-containing protein [Maridesulfovibrio sp.]|uniref:HDOD domain-containing protein n=1 Tax=Maridesulfovibrio sp. TaxID=2795000 RepID=UPI002A18B447|nr:HDOD domain-containing protein [Maridesulfovibrio sp.]